MISPIFLILLPLALFILVGLVGSTRRIGFWPPVLLSLLITPVGGFLVAVLSGPRRVADPGAKDEARTATKRRPATARR